VENVVETVVKRRHCRRHKTTNIHMEIHKITYITKIATDARGS